MLIDWYVFALRWKSRRRIGEEEGASFLGLFNARAEVVPAPKVNHLLFALYFRKPFVQLLLHGAAGATTAAVYTVRDNI